jgi:predicted transposase/invertase (TIGR01784 family)
MSNRILSTKVDATFRMLFGDVRHTEILEGFLKATLDIPADEYDHIEIDDPHLMPEQGAGKEGILDVRIHTTSGIIVEVEIQQYTQTAFRARLANYVAGLVTHQLSRGDDYTKIKRVISIAITDFELIAESAAYHHRFVMYDKVNGVELTDVMEIDVLELPKLPAADDGTMLYEWLKFIDTEEEEEMAELAEKNPEIKKAYAVLRELSEDETARRIAEAREKEQRDKRGQLDFAEKSGEKRGEKRATNKAVDAMKQVGVSEEQIEAVKALL